MEKQKLEIGDEIYCKEYGVLSYIGKVDRVTEKFAMVGAIKFNRDRDGRFLRKSPRQQWLTKFYFIPDESDILELRKQNLVASLKNYDYSKLPIEKLSEIRDIIKR